MPALRSCWESNKRFGQSAGLELVQCLTLLVIYPEYSTTKEDTKITKEELILLKSSRHSNALSVLRVLRALRGE